MELLDGYDSQVRLNRKLLATTCWANNTESLFMGHVYSLPITRESHQLAPQYDTAARMLQCYSPCLQVSLPQSLLHPTIPP